jgi:uncharacterized protein
MGHHRSQLWPEQRPGELKMTRWIAHTSGLYASLDRQDLHHGRATAFLKTYTQSGSLVTSNHLWDEVMTVSKVRLSTQIALQLGLRLRNSRFVEIVVLSVAQEQETWRVFSQYADKDWSYTDCAYFVLARQLNIQYAFTFRHPLAQMGLATVP